MVRRSFRFGLRLGLLFGIGFAVFKTVQSRRASSEPPAPEPWKPITDSVPRPAPAPAAPTIQPEPPVDEVGEPILEPAPEPPAAPARPAPAKAVKKAAKAARKAAKTTKKASPAPAYVEPSDGICPPTHPIKAKLASRLFHAPGMFAYPRTRPDRCYRDADAAVADGFTSAKR